MRILKWLEGRKILEKAILGIVAFMVVLVVIGLVRGDSESDGADEPLPSVEGPSVRGLSERQKVQVVGVVCAPNSPIRNRCRRTVRVVACLDAKDGKSFDGDFFRASAPKYLVDAVRAYTYCLIP
jgi:hypothetical protein